MALSAKNLTHALSEVRGVCHSDTSSRKCLFSASPIWVPLTVCPYALIAKLQPKRVENEATVHENPPPRVRGTNGKRRRARTRRTAHPTMALVPSGAGEVVLAQVNGGRIVGRSGTSDSWAAYRQNVAAVFAK